MRGFDLFMETARRIYEAYPDVLFLVVGSDEICYGGDERFIQAPSFREHVLRRGEYDLSRFHFPGWVSEQRLAEIFSLSDLHIYLTVPFVLSWSVFNALACECVVLGSDTAPVREVIRHRETGLLAGFYDVEGLAREAVAVLRHPQAYRSLGEAGRALVQERYSTERCLPATAELYERVKGQAPLTR